LIIPAKNQNQTDLQKAIDYCDSQNATQIDVVCIYGERLDHQMGAVRVLSRKYKSTRPIYLHNACQTVEFVRDTRVDVLGDIGDACGILALTSCTFRCTNDGLMWSSDKGKPYQLRYAVFDSIANYLVKKIARLVVDGDALIVHPGKLRAQRAFSLLSKKEQYEKLLAQESLRLT
jgi:hypothetical protein